MRSLNAFLLRLTARELAPPINLCGGWVYRLVSQSLPVNMQLTLHRPSTYREKGREVRRYMLALAGANLASQLTSLAMLYAADGLR